MDQTRAQAYGRVIRTLEDVGPAKLQPTEQDEIRQAADDLLFDESPSAALARVESLADHLVASGRWTEERARRLVDDVAACGPHAGVH